MKLPYREGTWFAVPLRDGGFAVGVVARATPKGKIILCYFFGPRRSKPASISDVRNFAPHDAILVHRVGDLGLINGEWPILGELPSWDRNLWSMPQFVRKDELCNRAWRVYYSDNDPAQLVKEEPEPLDSKLERHGLLGYGAAEILVTKRLNQLSRSE
jgi:hypothetical protein